MNKIIFVVFFLLVFVRLSSSQDDSNDNTIIGERPGFTNPPQVVPLKSLQIESGFNYEYDKIKETGIKTDNYLYPTTLLRYGLMKNLELRLQFDIAGQTTTLPDGSKASLSGLNPIIIGTKIYICKQNKLRPESALVFSLTLPYIGKQEFSPQYPAPGVALYFMNTLNSKSNIGYNFGMQWSGNDANPTSYVSICPAYNITSKLGTFVEVYSFFTKGQIPDIRSSLGFNYIPIPNLQFDVYGGPGIAGTVTNYFISAGISLRLPR